MRRKSLNECTYQEKLDGALTLMRTAVRDNREDDFKTELVAEFYGINEQILIDYKYRLKHL